MTVPITAIVAAHCRPWQTVHTLARIQSCDPAPAEILVHVDRNDINCAATIRRQFPELTITESATPVGPGGARNALVGDAKYDIIASFDDDSFPIDSDFFARAINLFNDSPSASAIGAAITHQDETAADALDRLEPAKSFVSCGVVYRRSAFLEAGGFVPLIIAYSMEETDLCLRMIDQGKEIYVSPWLRVFHDTDRTRHADRRITSGTIANLALLAWLRYPPRYWHHGLLQVLNRVKWQIAAKRFRGIASGLLMIPSHLRKHSRHRRTVSHGTMKRYLERTTSQ